MYISLSISNLYSQNHHNDCMIHGCLIVLASRNMTWINSKIPIIVIATHLQCSYLEQIKPMPCLHPSNQSTALAFTINIKM